MKILIKILSVILILLEPAGALTLILSACFSNEVAMTTGFVLMGIPFIIGVIVLLVTCIYLIIIE